MIEARMNYTFAEAAKLVGVNRCTVYRDAMNGAIPFHRVTKAGCKRAKAVVKGSDLERYRLRLY